AGGLPPWAVVPARDPADWALFVRTLAGRLRGRVTTWVVWNEPDVPLFWDAGGEEFVTLLRLTAGALSDVDPSIRVLVNLVNRDDAGMAFSDTVLAGAGDVIDVFGFHYSSADARDFLPLLRSGATVWNTEAFGAPRRQISGWLTERA